MEKKERTHTIEQKFAEHLLNILRHKGCLDNAGDDVTLERIEVDFGDGTTVEIDICNGNCEDGTSPYMNVLWFQNNVNLHAPDTDPEGELFGTYIYEDDDNEINYILHLVIGEKGQTFRM